MTHDTGVVGGPRYLEIYEEPEELEKPNLWDKLRTAFAEKFFSADHAGGEDAQSDVWLDVEELAAQKAADEGWGPDAGPVVKRNPLETLTNAALCNTPRGLVVLGGRQPPLRAADARGPLCSEVQGS